jgi:thioredoxin reductase
MDDRYEVVVIGGGAAGLSGALTLARARRSVLVIDAGQPRNAPAGQVHTYLTREGTPPAQLLATGRAEVTGYGGQITQGTVVAARRLDDGGFRVTLADGTTVEADRLLVATGLVDELPSVPGLAERFGRDVLHCPYCHGWEVRDEAIGVLATGPLAVEQALLWRQWSKNVTLFLHTAPEPTDEQYEQLAARDIAVIDGEVTGLEVTGLEVTGDRLAGPEVTGPEVTGDRLAGVEVTGDRLAGVVLASGQVIACRALVVGPHMSARTDVLASLGLATVEQERNGHVVGSHIAADPMGATPIPGVWVAGNVTSLFDQVIAAAAAGARAGAAINADLIAQETRQAVAVAVRRAA